MFVCLTFRLLVHTSVSSSFSSGMALVFSDFWHDGKELEYQEKLWVSSYRPKCCQPIKLQGSLRYLNEEVINELYFCHANKHQSLLKADTIILGMYNQTCRKNPK